MEPFFYQCCTSSKSIQHPIEPFRSSRLGIDVGVDLSVDLGIGLSIVVLVLILWSCDLGIVVLILMLLSCDNIFFSTLILMVRMYSSSYWGLFSL